MSRWLGSGILRRILLSILAVSLVPGALLGALTFRATQEAGTTAVERSREALDAKAAEALELRAVETARAIANFLQERENDLRLLALLPRTPDAYLAFAQAYQGELWLVDGGREVRRKEPVYRELAYVDAAGRETLKIVQGRVAGAAELRDVSDPANTLHRSETYFLEARTLGHGQVAVSHVTGPYVSRSEVQAGQRFQGVVRFATPVFDRDGRFEGVVALALDSRHVAEFTAHLVPTEQRFAVAPDPAMGNYAYLIDDQGYVIGHPDDSYIVGLGSDGQRMPYATQTGDIGRRPLKLDQLGFVDENLASIPGRTARGEAGSIQYFWDGLTKFVAYAPIPYYAGPYQPPAGFGWVGIGADVATFHKAATLVGAALQEKTQELIASALTILALTGLAVLLSASLLARQVSRPVQQLTQAARAVERGEFEPGRQALQGIRGQDELANLATVFSKMTVRLEETLAGLEQELGERKRAEAELRRYQEGLEDLVQARTAELAATNERLVGEIVERKRAEQEMQESHQSQSALNAMLRIALEEAPLEQQLDRALEVLLSTPWMRALPRGAVFLVEDDPDVLVLKAQRGLAPALLTLCARVPFGRCLCGRAAASRQTQFVDCVDDRHDIRFEGMSPHGHYSLPIVLDGKVLGVIVLFVGEGYRRDEREVAFLEAVAYTFAGLIGRKQAQAQLQESEARNRLILDRALDAIVSMDAGGKITGWNPQAEAMFGWPRQEVIGREVGQVIVPPQHREAHAGGIKRFLATRESRLPKKPIEIGALHRDGYEFPVELAISVVEVGGTYFFTAIIRDITDRKRAEGELRAAMEAAETANRAKSSFLANMSHELRTPLNAIIGYSEMLQEEAQDLGQEDFIPDLQKINAAGKHLLGLINDVLDLSKIEAGKMDLYLEDFRVADMVRDAVSVVQPLVAKNRNSLEVHCPDDLGAMHADLTKVRQAVFNLLSNACKFTERGTITLEVAREMVEGAEWVSFRVSDTGIGMTAEQMGKLFQAFTQAEASTTRKYGGTGLGLALSRRLCQMMGGDISVASEYGQGSSFTIRLPVEVVDPKTLPAAPSGEAAGAEAGAEPAPNGASTVLVIDDDPTVRELMLRFLSKEGYRVVCAAGGEEGLRLARAVQPAAITLDVMMPSMDGWTVLAALKADPDLADIPVIMLTMVDDRNMGYALGASDYLNKPIDRERLSAVLQKHQPQPASGPVLVVEDDAPTCEMTRRMLEREGWTVVEAANGRVGLERVAERRPGLILLDLVMPEMDGFEFVQELRKSEAWRAIPIVVMTAKELTQEDRRRLEGQVERIVQKGAYSREEVLREVRDRVAASVRQSTVATT